MLLNFLLLAFGVCTQVFSVIFSVRESSSHCLHSRHQWPSRSGVRSALPRHSLTHSAACHPPNTRSPLPTLTHQNMDLLTYQKPPPNIKSSLLASQIPILSERTHFIERCFQVVKRGEDKHLTAAGLVRLSHKKVANVCPQYCPLPHGKKEGCWAAYSSRGCWEERWGRPMRSEPYVWLIIARLSLCYIHMHY